MTLYMLFERLERRQDQARYRDGSVGPRLRTGARPSSASGPASRSRSKTPSRAGDPFRQRRRRRDRGSDRRGRRRFRQADDAQGARARHEQDRLPQRLGPARRRPGHDGARSGDARPRHPGPLPALLPYFSTDAFNYHGQSIRNHNHLLGSVEGVDGIKTGYTRASGFNLVTSMRRGNRHLVGVVLGGRSGGSRDAIMRNLLAENLERRRPRAPSPRSPSATCRTPTPMWRRPTPSPGRPRWCRSGALPLADRPRRRRDAAVAPAKPSLIGRRGALPPPPAKPEPPASQPNPRR